MREEYMIMCYEDEIPYLDSDQYYDLQVAIDQVNQYENPKLYKIFKLIYE